VRELEDKGIGRPSTYAQIIDTLKNRKYVTAESKRFAPTEVGVMVKNILVKEFPDVFDVGFTASMEGALDKVELGEVDWVGALHTFYDPFQKQLEIAKGHIQALRAQNQETTGRTCPECKKFQLVVKWSRNGKFLACQGFPACRYTEPIEKAVAQKSNEVCDKCGAPMVILEMKGNRFLGCSRYPECKNTRSLTTGVACPKACGGMLIERRTHRGKTFYGCNKYPSCTFATWDRPINEKCPKCGFDILTRRETKRKGTYNKCPRCKAEFVVAPPAPEEAE
jgi:DNA topoisomerase-1